MSTIVRGAAQWLSEIRNDLRPLDNRDLDVSAIAKLTLSKSDFEPYDRTKKPDVFSPVKGGLEICRVERSMATTGSDLFSG